jgi:hypothetical protein
MKPTPIKMLLLGLALLAFGSVYSGLTPVPPYNHTIGPTSAFAGLFMIVGSLGWMWGRKSSKNR